MNTLAICIFLACVTLTALEFVQGLNSYRLPRRKREQEPTPQATRPAE